ncbi:MAG: LuxR C-terminal-related transcriptional regulator [Cyanobacteria bacterium P01_F01_bin.116]
MTKREQEVLCHIITGGETDRQIAESLFISERTVKNHVTSI